MKQIQSIEQVTLHDTWVSIGSFDGVHLGHQALIRGFVDAAHAAGCHAVVITFFPHPIKIIRGNNHPYYLTTPEERSDMLEALGVDNVLTLEFSQKLADTSAETFITGLCDHLGMKQLWVGFNFALGKGREGDIPALREMAKRLNFHLEVMQPISINGEILSSSLIRNLLAQGNVAKAGEYLGRKYRVIGQVVHGDGRGHSIGIPTANLEIWPEQLLPARGVYSGWAYLEDGSAYFAVANVGLRPTFESNPTLPRLEVMLLDFDRNLYGQTVTFEFSQYLRGEQRFPSAEKLLEQIHQDIQKARGGLSDDPRSPDLSAGPQRAQS